MQVESLALRKPALRIAQTLTSSFYSIDKKMIFRTKVNTYSGFKVIDTRCWTPGIYSFMLSDKGKLSGSAKLIKTY